MNNDTEADALEFVADQLRAYGLCGSALRVRIANNAIAPLAGSESLDLCQEVRARLGECDTSDFLCVLIVCVSGGEWSRILIGESAIAAAHDPWTAAMAMSDDARRADQAIGRALGRVE